MLPDGFVDGRDQRRRKSLAGPVIEKMKGASGQRGEKDA